MAHRVPADVRDTFMRHDRNRSGRLDYRELRNTLEALSLDTTTSHAADLLKRYDADGNGLLDLDEFYTMVRELREWQWSTCPPDVRAKFLEFDKDRNGRLDYRELRNALQAHAAPHTCSSTRLHASLRGAPRHPHLRASRRSGSTRAGSTRRSCSRGTIRTAAARSKSKSSPSSAASCASGSGRRGSGRARRRRPRARPSCPRRQPTRKPAGGALGLGWWG
jgi:Ca2+-binding EF-hand superfamily protein